MPLKSDNVMIRHVRDCNQSPRDYRVRGNSSLVLVTSGLVGLVDPKPKPRHRDYGVCSGAGGSWILIFGDHVYGGDRLENPLELGCACSRLHL